MIPMSKSAEPEWHTLARQASTEEDPDKALDLAERIVEKFEEEKRRNNIIN